MTPEFLRAFEDDIAAEFEAGKIRAPVHLAGGNEAELIRIFRDHVKPQDYVLCSWRSHYHCLLKGVPAPQLKQAIMDGRSIALCFPEYRILSSAIVGGICPIATGLGWAIKQRGGRERVHVFVGDMTARTGIFHECLHYSIGHNLPISFWTEDNQKSVCTDTAAAWGNEDVISRQTRNSGYLYDMTRPHVGTGTWVRF